MTEDELSRIEASGKTDDGRAVDEDLMALIVDVRRLKAVIDRMRPGAGEQCLWCSRLGWIEPHAADCPAFTPEGAVK